MEDEAETKLLLPFTNSLVERILEVLIPEATAELSRMFEALTGEEGNNLTPIPDPVQESFLSTDEEETIVVPNPGAEEGS